MSSNSSHMETRDGNSSTSEIWPGTEELTQTTTADRHRHVSSESLNGWSEHLPPALHQNGNQELPPHSRNVLEITNVADDDRSGEDGFPSNRDHDDASADETWRGRPRMDKFSRRVRSSTARITGWLQIPEFVKKRLTFYKLHFLYISTLLTTGTFILWLSPKTGEGVSFVDALFNATSASCVVGLVSLDLTYFSTFDQVVIMFLVLAGGHVFTSLLPVLIRRYYFHMYIKMYTLQRQPGLERLNMGASDASSGLNPQQPPLLPIREHMPSNNSGLMPPTNGNSQAYPRDPHPEAKLGDGDGDGDGDISMLTDENALFPRNVSYGSRASSGIEVNTAEGAPLPPGQLSAGLDPFPHARLDPLPHSHTWSGDSAKIQGQRLKAALEVLRVRMQYRQASEDGNSHAFKRDDVGCGDATTATGEEEDRYIDPSMLRTQEYRALLTLSWLVPTYLLVIHITAFIIIHLNFLVSDAQRQVLEDAHISTTFFSAFQVVSGFQNAGLLQLPDSLIPFRRAVLLLLTVGSLILLGNTMYAPTMRGIIYLLYRVAGEKHKSTFKYLLDHPRKCYTHLFPWNVTKWLVVTVIAFNATELFFFCLLDWNLEPLEGLSGGHRFLIGLFQSLNTRSSGFAVVSLGQLSPAMLVMYVVMMYVAVYPVYLSRQSSKEQKEMYDDLDLAVFKEREVDTRVLSQARVLLARDSALVFLAMFIICIVESPQIEKDPNFSLFNIFFEVVSAYGNVGLSLGYTCIPESVGVPCVSPAYSLAGAFKPFSKVVLAFTMLMGRHRGLPDNIDAAVTIPAKKTFRRGRRRTIRPEDIDPMDLFRAVELDLANNSTRRSPFGESPSFLGRFTSFGTRNGTHNSRSHGASPSGATLHRPGSHGQLFKSVSLPSGHLPQGDREALI